MTSLGHKIFGRKTVPVQLITSIAKLPLSSFIAALVHEDFTGLIVTGIPSDNEILTAWNELYTQYLEALGGKELSNDVEHSAYMAMRQSKVTRMASLIKTIELFPCENLYNLLFSEFNYYQGEMPPYSEENLKEVVAQIKPFYLLDKTKIDIEIAEQEEQPKEEIKYTEEYFTSTIIDISAGLKVAINENELSTAAYCAWFNKYKKYIELLEKHNEQK